MSQRRCQLNAIRYFRSQSRRNRVTRAMQFFQHLEQRHLLAGEYGLNQPEIDVSPAEQLMIELINRARANPAAEATRLGIGLNDNLEPNQISTVPKQPLAPDAALLRAAELHSLDMIERDYFSHDTPDGVSPWTRAETQGYTRARAENLAKNWTDGGDMNPVVQEAHDLLFRSAGHRVGMLLDDTGEVGIGIEVNAENESDYSAFRSVLTTEMFGSNGDWAALTGVVFDDSIVADDFYTIGEGIPDLLIEAVANDGTRYRTRTSQSGGYALRMPPGDYTIETVNQADGQRFNFETLTLGSTNVKQDVLLEQIDQRKQPSVSWESPARIRFGTPLDETQLNAVADVPGSFEYLPREGTVLGVGNQHALSVTFTPSDSTEYRQVTKIVYLDVYAIASPRIESIEIQPVSNGRAAGIEIQMSGGNGVDLVMLMVDWGDGAETREIETSGNSTVGMARTFAKSGEYTVRCWTKDELNGEGEAVIVTVRVSASELQNPLLPWDVNGDAVVSAADALQIINRLSDLTDNVTSIPVKVDDRGPDFLDANGDGVISAADALFVINKLSEPAASRIEAAEGERLNSDYVSGSLACPVAETHWKEPFRMKPPEQENTKIPTVAPVTNDNSVVVATETQLGVEASEAVAADRSHETLADESLASLDAALCETEWSLDS